MPNSLINIEFTLSNETGKDLHYNSGGTHHAGTLKAGETKLISPFSLRDLLDSFSFDSRNWFYWLSGSLANGGAYKAVLKEVQQGGDTISQIHVLTVDTSEVMLVLEPFSVLREKLKALKDMGISRDFLVTIRGQVDYLRGREISNSRFDYHPGAVAFPKTAEDVSLCIRYCREHKIRVRVRSGGHQHEGMCSAENVLMIRMSEMNQITYNDQHKETAWIGVGKKLENVYYELELYGRTIPGGGCQSVNVGGLTQGGGWGSLTRLKGLTCDNILEAEVVLSDGTIIYANKAQHKDLFWALRGGGGGNFGIVTRFKFELTEMKGWYESEIWRVERSYGKVVLEKWQQEMEKDMPDTIITIVVHAHYQKDEFPVWVVFRRQERADKSLQQWVGDFLDACEVPEKARMFVGRSAVNHSKQESQLNLEHALREHAPLPKQEKLSNQEIEKFFYELIHPLSPNSLFDHLFHGKRHPDQEATPTVEAVQVANAGRTVPPPPSITCDAPHPHKISSAFQKIAGGSTHDEKAIDTVLAHAANPFPLTGARAYITFHALGGNVLADPAQHAFFYGDRIFLLQLQTWWADPQDPDGQAYIDWVRQLRDALEPDVEGAFINFVDYELVKNPESPEGREKLLKYYYGKNLARLQKVKQEYDPENFFEFRMSL